MKNKFFLISTLIVIILMSCRKDDEIKILDSENLITNFSILIDGQIVEGKINEDDKTILVDIPFCSKLTGLSPTITVSNNATVFPKSDFPQDFNSTIKYIVTAENGLTRKYDVKVQIKNEIDITPKIASFKINYNNKVYSAVILRKNIFLSGLPSTADLTSLTPIITTSNNADYSPKGSIDASSGELEYRVTKNGDISKYKVHINQLLGDLNLESRYNNAEDYMGTAMARPEKLFVYLNVVDNVIRDLKNNNPSENIYYEYLFSTTPDFEELVQYVSGSRTDLYYTFKVKPVTKYYMLMNIYKGDGANRVIVGKSYKKEFETPKLIDLSVLNFSKDNIKINVKYPDDVNSDEIFGTYLYIGDDVSDFDDNTEFSFPLPFENKFIDGERIFDISSLNLIPNKQYYVRVKHIVPFFGVTYVSEIKLIKFCKN